MDSYLPEVISGIILTILVLIKVFSEVLAKTLVEPVKRWINRKRNSVDERTLNSGRMVNDLLLELRVKTNSDRSAIFLFHNGQYFNPNIINNSIWKFTCAYENCKPGISYESIRMQSLLITNFLPMIETLWGKMSEGFEKYNCQNCPTDCDKSKNIIVICDEETLPYGSVKNLLETQGIKKLVLSPIIINNDFVGFIGVSYSNNFLFAGQIIDTPAGQGGIKNVCEYANKIGYHLSSH